MAFFKSLFGAKSAPPPPNPDTTQHDAIRNLKENKETLEKKMEIVKSQRDQEDANVKQKMQMYKQATNKRLAEKYKKEALPHLRRLKAHEDNYKQLDAQLFNIETYIEQLGKAAGHRQHIQAMKAFKAGMVGMPDLETVEDLQDEAVDMMDENNAIADALANPLAVPGALDEDDLEDAFNDFLQEDAEEEYDPIGQNQPAYVQPQPVQPQPVMPVAGDPIMPAAGGTAPVPTAEDKFAALEADMMI